MPERGEERNGNVVGNRSDADRYRDYADAAADWFWELDPNFVFTLACRRHDGRSVVAAADLLGKTPWGFAGGDPVRDPEWSAFRGKLERRRPFRNFRVRLDRGCETPVYWQLSGVPLIGSGGEFLGYRGVAVDVTAETLRGLRQDELAVDALAALEGLSDGVACFDARDKLVSANSMFYDVLRLPRERLRVGGTFAAFAEAVGPVLAAGTVVPRSPVAGAVALDLADGRKLAGRISALPSGGHVVVLRTVHTLPAAAANAAVTTRAFMDHSPQPFFAHVDGRIVYANAAAAEVFGCTLATFRQMEIWDFLVPSEIPRLRRFADDRMRERTAPSRYRVMARRLDGTPIYLEFRVTFETWDERPAFHVFVHDRTAERHAEDAWQLSERRFKDLVEGSIQGIVVHRDWKIVYANAAAATIFGYTPESFVGVDMRTCIAPEELERVADYRRRRIARDPEVPDRYEMLALGQGGRRLVVDVSSRLVDWAGGPAVQATIVDVSRRVETEAHLRQAKEAAETADRAKTEFLGNMSHELRTPLNAIIGFSQLIRDQIAGDIGPSYIEYANSIHVSGLHLLDVVNDMLDVAAIESGTLMLQEEAIDVAELVQDCRRMILPRVQSAGQTLSVLVGDPAPVLHADPRRIKQILINLLSNSVKFTETGGHIHVAAGLDEAGRIYVAVEDNGIGITPEDQETIFDAFVRVDQTMISRREGTGLGLPIVRALAQLHGAELDLKSEPGAGTTVRVLFPLSRTLTASSK